MVYVITYFMIGLAIVIFYGIYALVAFKDDWMKVRDITNEVVDSSGFGNYIFSGSEAYRCFIVGLLVTGIAWPYVLCVCIKAIYGILKNYFRK